ncbi:MAG: acyl-ACP thioesterase [Bacteroidetes bacterium]|nr:acyl-ACP thioesterase [Bacteroidota bacterium]
MIHTEIYRVRNYEADSRGRLTLLSLANYLQDTADRHAILLGVGMPALAEQGLSWVLHRMKINIIRWPQLTEEIRVETNPSGLERVFVFRDFRVYDQAGELLMTASSTWLVFDTEKRRMVSPGAYFQEIFDPYRALEFLPRAVGKIPAVPPTEPWVRTVSARHNEIDTNDHVNNSVYFQWIQEPLPPQFMHSHRCTEIDLVFKKECSREDRIESKVYPFDSTTLLHLVSNLEGKEVAIGTTAWREISP